jgi:hypothetical protein
VRRVDFLLCWRTQGIDICVSEDQLDVQLVLADMLLLLVAEVVKIDERSK